jgi:hypothetical protein
MNPFAEHYVPIASGAGPQPSSLIPEDIVQVRYSQDLAAEVKKSEKQGYRRMGSSEFVDRGNRMGVSNDARLHAAAIGASLVLFSSIPAKLRAIKRRRNGTIDISSVLADPPAAPSPRGYYVVQAAFLARVS